MFRRTAVLLVAAAAMLAGSPALDAFASTAATVGAASSLTVVPGTTAPIGNLTVTESAPGQLAAGDVVTVQLKDSAAAATLHLTTTPVVSGTNGLAATLAVASSSGTLQDKVVLTITQASSGSFPGVLTVAQLNPAIDAGAATGNATAYVSDTAGVVAPALTPVSAVLASVVTSGTLKSTFAAVTQPTLSSTASNQTAGSITIAEPAKQFFHTGDVITFRVRDVYGSADTIGLAATPLASGGAMSVSVQGLNGSTVQPNETGFKVSIDAQDPSNGSTSTLTVSNIVLSTAQAPSGPITLSAAVTTGASSEYIVPGRVTVATVGGNTTTSSAGDPVLTVPGTAQVGGNLTITVAAGALRAGDSFSLAIQEAGVTFNTTAAPVASLTAGNLSLSSATAQLDAGAVTATWTVQNPNSVPSTIVLGPLYYDVAAVAFAGHKVSLKTSGGGSYTSQTVTNGKLVASTSGAFTTAPPPVSTSSDSPVVFPGVDVTYVEPSAGSLAANNSAIVLLSPYANQIAAYRTTFAAAPTATVTGNLTLGAPVVNSQTISVTTATGVISAPAQTAAIFPVTGASSGTPAQVTFGNISYQLGNYVPPGTLLGTATANTATGAVTAASTAVAGTVVAGNQYADAIDGNGLGSAAANDTTPPETFLDGGPADGSTVFNTSTVTFWFHSSEDPYATFTCTLMSHTTAGDSSTVFENNCGQASDGQPVVYSKTYPSLADGTYTFYVQATDAANNTDPTPAGVSFSVGYDATPPTATVTPPKGIAGTATVTFSEPVEEVTPADLTISPAVTGGSSLVCANGGTAVDCAAGPVTVARVVPTTAFTPGQTYTVTADPAGVVPGITDLAGNPLAQTSGTFRASQKEQETSRAATPTWRKVSASGASAGSYVVAHQPGASASYPFSGTSVTWYTVTGPAQGKAAVYVDGAKKLSVNNYAAKTHYGVARTVGGLAAGSHTLKVVVAGAKGSSSGTDTQVAVDKIVAGATTEATSPDIAYRWRSVAATSASGGHYAVDDLAGAAVTFSFAGTGVTWWTVTSPSMGKAAVYVDGVKKATVDNYSAAAKYGVKRTFGGLSSGPHVLRIVVLGTHRSAAKGSSVAIDRWTVT